MVAWLQVLCTSGKGHCLPPGCVIPPAPVHAAFRCHLSAASLLATKIRKLHAWSSAGSILYACVNPVLYLAMVILIKRLIIGKFKPGPRDTSHPWQLLRHWLMAQLLPNGRLGGVAGLVGTHWEPISWIYRWVAGFADVGGGNSPYKISLETKYYNPWVNTVCR